LKIREIIKIIEKDGWYKVAQKGSHKQYKHPVKPGRVTVAGKPGDEIAVKPGRVTVAGKPGDEIALGTLNSILKQSGLKKEEE